TNKPEECAAGRLRGKHTALLHGKKEKRRSCHRGQRGDEGRGTRSPSTRRKRDERDEDRNQYESEDEKHLEQRVRCVPDLANEIGGGNRLRHRGRLSRPDLHAMV